MVLDYKGRNDIANWTCINYLQYVQSRWGLRTPSLLRAGYPTLLTWKGEGGEGVRFDQAQDQQVVTTRRPRIVTECLLTRSMLIKMYVYAISTIISWAGLFVLKLQFRLPNYLLLQKIKNCTWVSLVHIKFY